MDREIKAEEIVLGGGCFWCMEAIYLRVKGILSVMPGYAGAVENGSKPSYEKVSAGKTGHAEVVKLIFDNSIISLEEILRIFFAMHDPTTLNRQGNDIGSQYRSIILYENQSQHDTAERILRKIAESKLYGDKMLVTELKKLEKFYIAEEYHWNYYEKHPEQGYCILLIAPKLIKFRNKFKTLFKEV